jgi:hypothetical protein
MVGKYAAENKMLEALSPTKMLVETLFLAQQPLHQPAPG